MTENSKPANESAQPQTTSEEMCDALTNQGMKTEQISGKPDINKKTNK